MTNSHTVSVYHPRKPFFVMAATWMLFIAAILSAAEPISIGSRRELFVDRLLIEKLNNVRMEMREPRDEGPVLRFDKPWEGLFAGYATVLNCGDRYRLYYRGVSKLGADGNENERTCMAESADGLHWSKPSLGLFEFEGSKENNIVLANAAPVTHNFSPMLDTRPGVLPAERFKAIGGTGKALFAFASADGIHWQKLVDEPILGPKEMTFPFSHLFDSQNLAFWSEHEKKYVCYFRVWDGLRRIARATSDDFRIWSNTEMMQQVHDDGSGPQPAPKEHLYTNQTAPYFRAPHISIAIAARFFEGRQVLSDEQAKAINVNPKYFRDTADAVLMTTRGGNTYDRTFLEGFLKPGIGAENWVSRTNYPALNTIQTSPTELSFFVNQNYAQPTAHLRRYSLRLDGFASVRAGAQRGEVITKPFVFSGKSLTINFATSAGGGIQIEFQQPDGTPISAFTGEDCQEQIGNEIERVVRWKQGSDVSSLAGKPVRMRIVMQDADLYSFRFVE